MKKANYKKMYVSPQATVVVMRYDTHLLGDSENLRTEKASSNDNATYDVGW